MYVNTGCTSVSYGYGSPYGCQMYTAQPMATQVVGVTTVTTSGVQVLQPLGATNIVAVGPTVQTRPPDYLALAIITAVCCNIFCGIAALVLSLASSSASDAGDYMAGRRHGKLSLSLSIIGIVTTVVILSGVCIWTLVVSMETARETVEGWEDYEGYYLR